MIEMRIIAGRRAGCAPEVRLTLNGFQDAADAIECCDWLLEVVYDALQERGVRVLRDGVDVSEMPRRRQ
jgi:hypothetical protein